MSRIVSLVYYGCIARVIFEDRNNKNTFTLQFITEIKQVFADIKKNKLAKVVIVHGYDNYFCCGGTKDELLRIHHGKSRFIDLGIHDIFLQCQLPVIAAMQGHAIGGGFVMGCFADFILLSRQSIYTTNFMNFGFTPGFGATYIIPKLFGFAFGMEMLFSGNNYYGADIESRHIGLKVTDKKSVIDEASLLAKSLLSKPKNSLCLLKAHFQKSTCIQLEKVIAQELEMHARSIHHEVVKVRIENTIL